MTPLSDVRWGCWANRCGLKPAFDCDCVCVCICVFICICICVWSLSSGVGGLGKSLWIEACFRFPLLFLPSRSLLMPAGSWHFDRTKAIHGLMMTMMIMVDDDDDDAYTDQTCVRVWGRLWRCWALGLGGAQPISLNHYIPFTLTFPLFSSCFPDFLGFSRIF